MSKPLLRRKRSLLRDTEGAAYVELLVMLPLFITLWAFTMWFATTFETVIDTRGTARQHAWAYAMDACEDEPSEVTVGGGPDTPLGWIATALGMMDSVLGLVPVFGDWFPGFEIESHSVTFEDRSEGHALIGTEDLQHSYELMMMCNEPTADDSFDFWVPYLWPPMGFF